MGPGGSPVFMYVLYGLSTLRCLFRIRFREKSFSANLIVGQACSGMSAFSRLRYIPAIIGFSSMLLVSSSIMLARVATWIGDRLMLSASCSRCWFQNLVF